MGADQKEMKFVRVTAPTLRKTKVLSAAFGVPIYAILKQAIDEMAENYKEQIMRDLEEVKHEQVRSKRVPRRNHRSR